MRSPANKSPFFRFWRHRCHVSMGGNGRMTGCLGIGDREGRLLKSDAIDIVTLHLIR